MIIFGKETTTELVRHTVDAYVGSHQEFQLWQRWSVAEELNSWNPNWRNRMDMSPLKGVFATPMTRSPWGVDCTSDRLTFCISLYCRSVFLVIQFQ